MCFCIELTKIWWRRIKRLRYMTTVVTLKDSLTRNNSKMAKQLGKVIAAEKQENFAKRVSQYLTREREILNRWTKYCSDLYKPPESWDLPLLTVLTQHQKILFQLIEKKERYQSMSFKKNEKHIMYRHNLRGTTCAGRRLLTSVCSIIRRTGVWQPLYVHIH